MNTLLGACSTSEGARAHEGATSTPTVLIPHLTHTHRPQTSVTAPLIWGEFTHADCREAEIDKIRKSGEVTE